jgi:hypothetical protein
MCVTATKGHIYRLPCTCSPDADGEFNHQVNVLVANQSFLGLGKVVLDRTKQSLPASVTASIFSRKLVTQVTGSCKALNDLFHIDNGHCKLVGVGFVPSADIQIGEMPARYRPLNRPKLKCTGALAASHKARLPIPVKNLRCCPWQVANCCLKSSVPVSQQSRLLCV